MCPADLLLLDEPTNHLDLDALVWLEAWLQRYAGTMIVISHDREFLDAVTEVTLHIDDAKLTRYGGNYSAFEEMRAERMEQQQAAFAQAAGTHRPPAEVHRPLQGQGQQGQAGAEPGQGAGAHGKAGAGAGRAPTSASSSASRSTCRTRCWRSATCLRLPADDEPQTILRGVNRSVLAGQRIGILGANGQGKSTLVKTIARDAAAAGRHDHRRQGPEHRLLRAAGTRRAAPGRRAAEAHGAAGARADVGARTRASRNCATSSASFRFIGEMVQQPVGTLSGGEKARLVLAMHGLAAPQPAAARRADQPPRPGHARGAGDGAQRVRRHA